MLSLVGLASLTYRLLDYSMSCSISAVSRMICTVSVVCAGQSKCNWS